MAENVYWNVGVENKREYLFNKMTTLPILKGIVQVMQ
jgi:hypothetical protein